MTTTQTQQVQESTWLAYINSERKSASHLQKMCFLVVSVQVVEPNLSIQV